MGATPAIPPPPAPDPNDVTPQLGPASEGSGSGMDRFRAMINHLSGGGTPAIQERLAADYAKRQQDAENFRTQAKNATTYAAHANATVGPNAPFGINPVTGQPATAQDVQGWHNDIDTGTQGYLKLLPKDAKPIAQKLFEVTEHAIGRKGKSGAPAGQSSAPLPQAPSGGNGDFGGEAGAPASAIPPPPQGAAPVAGPAAGPAVPPPPGQSQSQNAMELPAQMQPAILAAPEMQRMMGVQNTLSQQKQAEQEKQGVEIAGIGPKTQATTAADLARIQTIMQLPEEQRLPAMMSMGVISPALMHPVTKLVPNDPQNPAAGNHYESYIPLVAMMGGGQGPQAPLNTGLVPKQTTTTDPFGNVTTSVRKPVAGASASSGAGAGAGTPKAGLGGVTGRVMAVPPPLDTEGHVPQVQGVNPQLIENANQLLDGQDITKLPAKARTGAAALARKYGWEQGKFTPKEQTQVREASTFIQLALQDQNALSALDGDTLDRAKLAQVTSNPDKEGFIGRTLTSAAAQSMTPQQAAFVQTYNQLVGTIAGLSKLVRPGGTTEAQIERLKSELPNPVTTKNSADARQRLQRLQKEIDVAMAKGNFGQLGAAPTGGGGRPTAIAPPPTGAKKQFYRMGGKFYDAQTQQEIPAQGAQ